MDITVSIKRGILQPQLSSIKNSTHGNSNTRSVFALWPTDNFTGEWVLNFSWRDGFLRCNSKECVKKWAQASSGQSHQGNVCASSHQSFGGENAILIRNKLLSQGIGWVSLQPWWCNINETDIRNDRAHPNPDGNSNFCYTLCTHDGNNSMWWYADDTGQIFYQDGGRYVNSPDEKYLKTLFNNSDNNNSMAKQLPNFSHRKLLAVAGHSSSGHMASRYIEEVYSGRLKNAPKPITAIIWSAGSYLCYNSPVCEKKWGEPDHSTWNIGCSFGK